MINRKKIVITSCAVAFVSNFTAYGSPQDSSGHIILPRFIDSKELLSDKHIKVDLLKIFREKFSDRVIILDKNKMLDKGFQDEDDDRDFVEFDDNTITVPVELFKDHSLNVER